MKNMENAFTVLPISQNFTLEPGNTYTGSITVVNPVSSINDFSYSVSVSPYSVIGEDYQADIINTSAFSQIVDWITIKEPTGTLAPNEAREVEFTIKVPDNAYAGGQYAAILVSQDTDKQAAEGVSINNVFALGSIIYADVSGEVTHDSSIIENNVPEFATVTPVSVSALLRNDGNVHETAIVAIKATNNITGEKIFPTEENQNNRFSELVMPETTRFISRQIDNLPIVGIVKVEQTIYYGDEVSTATKDLIICPVWFMLLMSLILFGVISGIVALFRRRRKKKTI